MTATEKKTGSRRNLLLDSLRADYAVFRDTLPLAIGIHKVLRERHPDFEAPALRTALRLHTTSTAYLKAIAKAEQRFDLDGAPAGEVSAEQRQQAETELRERFKKSADRRKNEAEAARRQEKLEELARKFSRN
ncbi:MAG: ProQ/FinO family protein [Dechloromonas sp.]|jgi:ProP effector|nr:ProQ/FinO family protein [Dechloromonas sp.]